MDNLSVSTDFWPAGGSYAFKQPFGFVINSLGDTGLQDKAQDILMFHIR